jgi:hypothetical protein
VFKIWRFCLVLVVVLFWANASWAADFTIIQNDDFSDNRAPGAVDGTVSSSGVLRSVIDSENRIRIANDKLVFSEGQTFPNIWFEPIVKYPECQRIVNEAYFWQLTLNEITNKEMEIGLSEDLPSWNISHSIYIENGNIVVVNNNILYYNRGTVQAGTDYYFCIAIKDIGAQYFIKGGEYTDWTKLFEASDGSPSTFVPYIISYTAAFSCDFFRHVSGLNDLSNVWIVGPNLLTDPGLEANYTDGKCDSLMSYSNPALVQSADAYTGSKAQQFTGTVDESNIYFPPAQAVAGKWYRSRVQGKRTAGTTGAVYPQLYVVDTFFRYSTPIISPTYQQSEIYVQAQATGNIHCMPATQIGTDGFDTVIVDECELREVTVNLTPSLKNSLNQLTKRRIFSTPAPYLLLLLEE